MSADQSRKPCILVVEEERAIRDLLKLGLRARGFVVLLAASGREAIELYRSSGKEIEAVLLDVGMKDMDGPQTLAALRQLAPSLPCCFMTGGDPASKLMASGVVRVFAKPFSLDEVSETLRRVVSRPEPKAKEAAKAAKREKKRHLHRRVGERRA